MRSRQAIEPWAGLIAGVVAIAVGFLLLPYDGQIPFIATIPLCIGCGLAAGLFTRGTVMKGALTGFFTGCLVVAWLMAGMMYWDPSGNTPGANAGFIALLISVIFVPSNTIAGAIGVVFRRWIEKRSGDSYRSSRDSPGNSNIQWAGILIGSLIIAGSVFLMGTLSFLQFVPLLSAGIIAGSLSRGGIRAGLESGLITGVLGTGILSVPLLWISSQGSGFVAGLGGIVLVIMAATAIPSTVIGGIAGAVVKERVCSGQEPGVERF